MQYKQSTFAEPYVGELSEMHLVPNEMCVNFLRDRTDVEDLYVIQAVLSAEVKEQVCRELDTAAGVGKLGASVGGSQECLQSSEGHVAVAFKVRRVAEMLGIATEPEIEPNATAAALPSLPSGLIGGVVVTPDAPSIAVTPKDVAEEEAAEASAVSAEAVEAAGGSFFDDYLRPSDGKAKIVLTCAIPSMSNMGLRSQVVVSDGAKFSIGAWIAVTHEVPPGATEVKFAGTDTSVEFDAEAGGVYYVLGDTKPKGLIFITRNMYMADEGAGMARLTRCDQYQAK